MKRYILTGTPGSGKTTLLHALKDRGYYVVEEAATDIIHSEQSLGISEPWTGPSFIIKILELQIQREHLATESTYDIQIFDRSPICTYALCIFLGYPIPQTLHQEITRLTFNNVYETNVFFIGNLGYVQPTAARKISFQTAVEFEKLHKDTYQQFGYNLIHIPSMEIKKRTDYIINTLFSITN
jgi:predicted ATPase